MSVNYVSSRQRHWIWSQKISLQPPSWKEDAKVTKKVQVIDGGFIMSESSFFLLLISETFTYRRSKTNCSLDTKSRPSEQARTPHTSNLPRSLSFQVSSGLAPQPLSVSNDWGVTLNTVSLQTFSHYRRQTSSPLRELLLNSYYAHGATWGLGVRGRKGESHTSALTRLCCDDTGGPRGKSQGRPHSETEGTATAAHEFFSVAPEAHATFRCLNDTTSLRTAWLVFQRLWEAPECRVRESCDFTTKPARERVV